MSCHNTVVAIIKKSHCFHDFISICLLASIYIVHSYKYISESVYKYSIYIYIYYMSIYIICIYIYIYILSCIHIYVYIYVRCLCVCVCVCVCVCKCVGVCVLKTRHLFVYKSYLLQYIFG